MRIRLTVALAALLAVLLVGTAAAQSEVSTRRLSGANRTDTSVAISTADFPSGAAEVRLVGHQGLADAVASSKNVPVLILAPDGSLTDALRAELCRLRPATVTALGGTAQVPEATLAAARDHLRSGCSSTPGPSPSPRPPSPTPSPTPSPAPPPPPADGVVGPRPVANEPIPANAVTLTPTSNWQAVLDRHPAGTAYRLQAGRYDRFRVRPETGDRFYGDGAVVLDGKGSVNFAFAGFEARADNVLIQGVEVTGYNPGTEGVCTEVCPWGAIDGRQRKGWIIRNVHTHRNAAAGASIGPGFIVEGVRAERNGTQGLQSHGGYNSSSGYATGMRTIIRDSYLIGNKTNAKLDPFFEGGGTKLGFNGLRVHNNEVRDNNGPGLWLDVDNRNVEVDHNLVVNNAGVGILYEVSQGPARIHRNVVRDTRLWERYGYPGGAIEVNQAANVVIEHNEVVGGHDGLKVIEGTHPQDSTNVVFRNNQVRNVRRYQAEIACAECNRRADVLFDGNRYSGGGDSWAVLGNRMAFRQWQSAGNDQKGSHAR